MAASRRKDESKSHPRPGGLALCEQPCPLGFLKTSCVSPGGLKDSLSHGFDR